MRRVLLTMTILALGAAACGGGGPAATQTGAPLATPTGGQPAPTAGQPTPTVPPAQPGSGTVSVTLTGGPDAGTYTGSDNPNCSLGLIGPNGWGTQYSVPDGPDDQLSSLQLVSAAPGMADHEDAFYQGTEFLMTVTIGTLFADSARDYEVAVRTENSDDESSGTGSAQVTDSGSTAVIHATGTTADGVSIDATVNCPSVTRV